MKRKLQNWTAALIFAATLGGAALTLAVPQTVSAACNDRLLTFPTWYKGLTDADCNIKSPPDAGGISNFIWKIALNVIEIALQLVGYISVGFIIRGGFKYMTSAGDASEISKAKMMIKNAIIGLIISLISVAIVNLVVGAFE